MSANVYNMKPKNQNDFNKSLLKLFNPNVETTIKRRKRKTLKWATTHKTEMPIKFSSSKSSFLFSNTECHSKY